MNKTAIKNFAIWARNKLIADISYRAGLMGITEKGIADALPQSTLDAEFYDIGAAEPYLVAGNAIKQRRQLVEAIREKEADTDYKTAYGYIIEEVAYTWFNRLIAVRFMEINDYLPSHLRVLSSESGKVEPDLVTTPFDSDLPFTAEEEARILQWKQDNKLDELFRFLFIRQCNALNEILPGLFEKTTDYTELLLNLSAVDREGVVYKLTHDIPESDFNVEQGGQVEIIGWLYQYYNTEPKAAAFAKNGKITKEEIPAVTQLFTPDWIVRYMVENSLGRIFISGQLSVDSGQCSVDSREWSVDSVQCSDSSDHSSLTTSHSKWSEKERIAKEQEIADRMGWKYYLPEAEQTPEVRAALNRIQNSAASGNSVPSDQWPVDSKKCSVDSVQCSDSSDHLSLTTNHLSLTTLKVTDPCMGSGHILVYAFDVLMQIYTSVGYSERDAAKSILEHNLYGLDIDDRAYQLAYFAVMMKARQYNRRILNGENTCHVYAIQESNAVKRAHLKYFGTHLSEQERNTAKMQMEGLLDTLTDAKEYGSILNVPEYDWALLRRFVEDTVASGQLSVDSIGIEKTEEQLKQLVDIGETMARKYDVVVTNPPYAGTSNLSAKVNNFVKKYYPDSKADLFAVFIECCRQMTANNGYQAMITQHSWMFLSSFEKLREKMMLTETVNMAHLGARAFEEIGGEVVQTTAFVRCANHIAGYKGTYCRLIEPTSQQGKEEMFLAGQNRYTANQDDFAKIPGAPVAYWASAEVFKLFSQDSLKNHIDARNGMSTTDNNRFLRFWPECDFEKIGFAYKTAESAKKSRKKWFPYNKGGEFRRWYGNNSYVVNWFNDGEEMKKCVAKNYGSYSKELRSEDRYFDEGISWSALSSGNISMRYSEAGYIFDSKGSKAFMRNGTNVFLILTYLNSCVVQQFLKILSPTLDYNNGNIEKLPYIETEKKEVLITLGKKLEEESRADWDSFETSWDFKKHPLV